jgi:type VI protein secretion system component Hcp
VIALQRSAGNTSAMALLRRALEHADETPVTLTLPGVVDGAAVSSWSLDNDMRGERVTGLHITRPTDTDSPVLAKALTDGAPAGTATLVVRKLTPLGWVRQLTLTMEDCVVSSYQVGEKYESLGLTFTAIRVEQ